MHQQECTKQIKEPAASVSAVAAATRNCHLVKWRVLSSLCFTMQSFVITKVFIVSLTFKQQKTDVTASNLITAEAFQLGKIRLHVYCGINYNSC